MDESWRGERRGRFLDAAGRVFSRRAYGDASMDEIASEAGMGKPTLYRYFPSKQSLFAAVFVDALDTLEAQMAAVLEEEESLPDRLHGLVRAMLPTFRDHLVPLRFLGDEAAAVDQSRRRVFQERRARLADFLVRAVEDGIRSGEARRLDGARFASLTIGMVWGGAAAIDAPDDEVAAEIVDLALSGIADRGAALGNTVFRAATSPRAGWERAGSLLASPSRPHAASGAHLGETAS